jgi:WD repeat-containing protein 6
MENSSYNLQEKIPLVDRFKGAHGISSVTSVNIAESDSRNVEIQTVMIES